MASEELMRMWRKVLMVVGALVAWRWARRRSVPIGSSVPLDAGPQKERQGRTGYSGPHQP
jgi:hypothetical protein